MAQMTVVTVTQANVPHTWAHLKVVVMVEWAWEWWWWVCMQWWW